MFDAHTQHRRIRHLDRMTDAHFTAGVVCLGALLRRDHLGQCRLDGDPAGDVTAPVTAHTVGKDDDAEATFNGQAVLVVLAYPSSVAARRDLKRLHAHRSCPREDPLVTAQLAARPASSSALLSLSAGT